MLLYVVLLFLAVWRRVCSYWCFGLWLSILNYVSLLYVFLAAALVYLLIDFYDAAQHPLDVQQYPQAVAMWSVAWLKPFTLVAPITVCITFALNWLQTESHVFEIHKGFALCKHDRAVQIIALPAVFATMAFASMLPIFELTTGRINSEMLESPWYDFAKPMGVRATSLLHLHGSYGNTTLLRPPKWEEAKSLALWRYETCFYVADLFEAWVVFQFARLILELVEESILRQERPLDGEQEALSKLEHDLLDSHKAVTTLTWMGTSIFVVLCIVQSACSLWPYIGGSREQQETIMFGLNVGGFVASTAAIYNLIVVEQAFFRHLKPSKPVLKFLSVKLLVSLSFVQKGALWLIRGFHAILPKAMQRIVHYVPIIQGILELSDLQSHLFYAALTIFECFFVAILHLFVWRANEDWYKTGNIGTERQPLVERP